MFTSEDGIASRVVFGLFILAILSLFKSCEQMKFSTSGKEATVEISHLTETRNRRMGPTGYQVWFNFVNENTGKQQSGNIQIGLDESFDFQPGQQIQIEYIGEDVTSLTTRLKGSGSTIWLVLGFISIVVILGGLAWMIYALVTSEEQKYS